MTDIAKLEQEFIEFLAEFTWIEETRVDTDHGDPIEYTHTGYRNGLYFYAGNDIPSLDFNREIALPGKSKTYPTGILGLRVDADFWAVALLPYKFVDLPIEFLVEHMWPTLYKDCSFHPDSPEYDDGSTDARNDNDCGSCTCEDE